MNEGPDASGQDPRDVPEKTRPAFAPVGRWGKGFGRPSPAAGRPLKTTNPLLAGKRP